VNKPTRDETSCPLMLNSKGHCHGVVAIVGMPLVLISYDCGRLAHDETPYPFWEKVIFFIYIYYYFPFFKALLSEAHLLLKSVGWRKKCKNSM
jgi:hypothetical protein